ncbi:MAG: hypothetical protein EOP17_21245, partial [Rhizobiaceae bacterium]
KSATSRLVFLYVLAVLVICGAIGFVAIFFTQSLIGGLIAAAITLVIIAIGSLIRMRQLGGSGSEVAILLGGIPVDPATKDPLERRLLNVVEEMAIASGIPVPRVFILRGEAGINAFAAGMRPGEAVIGVTRGTLEQLNRDELQGVVAHEFSHIFNGDMRLNLRLMGVLGGILALTTIGRIMLNTSRGTRSSKKDGNAFIFIGFALVAIGFIGVFFARLIKAAVSRQREYLADASAVQYTRNPLGIGGALMKINGMTEQSSVTSPFAEEASHMFFGSVKLFSNMMATHPALEERIKRISPQILQAGAWKPRYENPTGSTSTMTGSEASTGMNYMDDESLMSAVSPVPQARAPRSQTEAAAARASAIVDTVGMPGLDDLIAAKDMIAKIPEAVRDQLRTPIGATTG